MSTQPPFSDFNPDEFVREHNRSIDELRAQVTKLIERFGDDDCFGKTFETMASKDKRFDKIVKESLRDLINSDSEVSKELEQHVKKLDRDWLGVQGKRVSFAIWSILLIVITSWANHGFKIK